jgi:hypothetical protein
MQFSRRSTLVYASALAASASAATGPAAALAVSPSPNLSTFQRVQYLVVHRDESGNQPYTADLSLLAPDTAWAAFASLNASELDAMSTKYAHRGYGLRRLNAFQTHQGMRYAAIWQWGENTPAVVRRDLTPAAFEQASSDLGARGYAVAHMDAASTASGPRFAAIWNKPAAPAQKIVTGLTGSAFRQQAAMLAAKGYAPRQIAGYAEAGRARFAAVFTRNVSLHAEHAVPAPAFHARSVAMNARGYALRDANGYVVGRKAFIAAVWERA